MTAIQLTVMTVEEAQATVDKIKSSLEDIRSLLFDLRERQGWKALGYESFRECITSEFAMSKQRAYQLVNAHMVDRILTAPWQESTAFFGLAQTTGASGESTFVDSAPIPEAHARALAPLIPEPEKLRTLYAEVQDRTNGRPTAAAIREVVDEHLASDRTPASRQAESAPFVMPEQEEETEEERAYFRFCQHRLIARYVPGAVAATPADPSTALPAWEEFERWFREFMVVLRARASRPVRLAE